MDEQLLIRQAVSGDTHACATLVRAHYPAVYRLLAQLTRDVHLAEDLCQDTFAAAWPKLGTFAGGSSLATWLHRIAYRQFLDFRRSARQTGMPRHGHEAEHRGQSFDPVAAAAADEQSRALCAALDRLNELDRQVLMMHYHMGLSYREIAEITDEPAGTIKWRTSVALARLRTILGINESDDELERRATTSSSAARPAAAADPAGA